MSQIKNVWKMNAHFFFILSIERIPSQKPMIRPLTLTAMVFSDLFNRRIPTITQTSPITAATANLIINPVGSSCQPLVWKGAHPKCRVGGGCSVTIIAGKIACLRLSPPLPFRIASQKAVFVTRNCGTTSNFSSLGKAMFATYPISRKKAVKKASSRFLEVPWYTAICRLDSRD